MKNSYKLFFAICLLTSFACAQEVESSIQLRPRYEYREGYKYMLQENESPTSFISQRSRLSISFKNEKLLTKISAQNVRVWGDVPTTTTSDKNGVMFFEAWAQYKFDTISALKIGRQVISFDNQRIMGEIDWAQQGQSHDAAVYKFDSGKNVLNMGVSFSSNAENLIDSPYNINNYKALQFVHYKTRYSSFWFSLLFLNTGYEFIKSDGSPETDYNQTFGTYITFKKNNFSASAAAYGQTGKRNDAHVKAWYTGVNASYKLNSNWELKGGFEMLSGKDQNDTDTDIESFNPLFGTNHAFNGHMDYFYVGNHLNSTGLQDAYIGLGYTKQKFVLELVPHLFWSHGGIYKDNEKLQSFLGAELDFSARYSLDKYISIYFGYSFFADTESLRVLKGTVGNPHNNWAWLMININMDLYKKHIASPL